MRISKSLVGITRVGNNRWKAQRNILGEILPFGSYPTPEQAAKAFDNASFYLSVLNLWVDERPVADCFLNYQEDYCYETNPNPLPPSGKTVDAVIALLKMATEKGLKCAACYYGSRPQKVGSNEWQMARQEARALQMLEAALRSRAQALRGETELLEKFQFDTGAAAQDLIQQLEAA